MTFDFELTVIVGDDDLADMVQTIFLGLMAARDPERAARGRLSAGDAKNGFRFEVPIPDEQQAEMDGLRIFIEVKFLGAGESANCTSAFRRSDIIMMAYSSMKPEELANYRKYIVKDAKSYISSSKACLVVAHQNDLWTKWQDDESERDKMREDGFEAIDEDKLLTKKELTDKTTTYKLSWDNAEEMAPFLLEFVKEIMILAVKRKAEEELRRNTPGVGGCCEVA